MSNPDNKPHFETAAASLFLAIFFAYTAMTFTEIVLSISLFYGILSTICLTIGAMHANAYRKQRQVGKK